VASFIALYLGGESGTTMQSSSTLIGRRETEKSSRKKTADKKETALSKKEGEFRRDKRRVA